MKKLLILLCLLTTISKAQIQKVQVSLDYRPLDSISTQSLMYGADFLVSKRGLFYFGGSVKSNHDFKDIYVGGISWIPLNMTKSEMIATHAVFGAGLNTDFSEKPTKHYIEYGICFQFLFDSPLYIATSVKRQHFGRFGNICGTLTVGRKIK